MVSALIVLAGLVALRTLPVSEYPSVTPPTIVVRATYPGASPEVVAETVALPLERAMNGLEGVLYQSSQMMAGALKMTITLALGTDVDTAQGQVQNRISQVVPRLPEEVQRLGVIAEKSASDLTMLVHLVSPGGRYDGRYLANFAKLHVKDALQRLDGVGSVQILGSGSYALRVWLDPEKIAARDMTASDVVRALREQNVQVAPGDLGGPPAPSTVAFQLSIDMRGRLATEADFENIVVRRASNGQVTLLSDVARVEFGAEVYDLRSLLDNREGPAIGVFQRTDGNAIAIADDVRALMATLSKEFPEDLTYRIAYAPTVFVRASIRAVVQTLLEALVLVVAVVIVFLQTWRASLIPLIAVPVSLIGTLAAMRVFGFSLNMLSLFGIVLAIGIVVDDAIVVVETVERNIRLGHTPLTATKLAMAEVASPIVATALALTAVFVPTAFIPGLSGQFYRQFAITIAISTIISTFNSLTLSPALAVLLLGKGSHRSQKHPAKWRLRVLDIGGRSLDSTMRHYESCIRWLIERRRVALAGYVVLLALTGVAFVATPKGFVPAQDKQYLVAYAELPAASSLDRTDSVVRRMGDIILSHPGVESAIALPGLSLSFMNMPDAGVLFATLKPFEQRATPQLTASAIASDLQARLADIQEAAVTVFPPPPVPGVGTVGGFKLQIVDHAGLGFDELYRQTQNLIHKANATPGLAGLFSSFQMNVPRLTLEANRSKAKSLDVSLDELHATLQIYLGSLYIDDITRFGEMYPVIVQAAPAFRADVTNIGELKTRNGDGAMIPLSNLLSVKATSGPGWVMHHNGFPAAEVYGAAAPGYSSGEARAILEQLAASELPGSMNLEWTDLTYQEILSDKAAPLIFPLCVLLVFLVLAAQYESLSLPFVVILVVPLCLLSAMIGVRLTGGDNNIFTQIGLLVLVGLACKNAILIVEFARRRELHGVGTVPAVLEACRLRVRPILMTSVAFVTGVLPLVMSTGAGAEMRRVMGTTVFYGMLGVTLFGLLLTPVFYVAVRGLAPRRVAEEPFEPSNTYRSV